MTEQEWKDANKKLRDMSQTRGLLTLPILSLTTYTRLFVMWPKIKREINLSMLPPIDEVLHERDLESILWGGVKVDEKDVKQKLGLEKVSEARGLFEALKNLCLIFPDGSINDLVLGVMVSRVSKGTDHEESYGISKRDYHSRGM